MVQNCHSHSVLHGQGDGLDRIVQTYLDHNAAGEERYLCFYATQRSIRDAISKAAMAELPNGKRFSHQRRIPSPVLARARDALLQLDYRGLKTFSELHELVAQALRPISGIGLLTIYDTAHRFGA